jgi:hypothetical protein
MAVFTENHVFAFFVKNVKKLQILPKMQKTGLTPNWPELTKIAHKGSTASSTGQN